VGAVFFVTMDRVCFLTRRCKRRLNGLVLFRLVVCISCVYLLLLLKVVVCCYVIFDSFTGLMCYSRCVSTLTAVFCTLMIKLSGLFGNNVSVSFGCCCLCVWMNEWKQLRLLFVIQRRQRVNYCVSTCPQMFCSISSSPCTSLLLHLCTNLVHSRAVRKLLVAIILSILKCLFYSRSIKI